MGVWRCCISNVCRLLPCFHHVAFVVSYRLLFCTIAGKQIVACDSHPDQLVCRLSVASLIACVFLPYVQSYLSLLIGLLFNSILPPRPSVLDCYNVKPEQACYVLQIGQCPAHMVGHLVVPAHCFFRRRILVAFMVHSSPFCAMSHNEFS